jgi:nucleotidyltransferase/DNA polymerase involved in DNA repair
MRLLHLLWPHLPLRLARSRSTSFPSGPVVLGGQPWTDGTVLDASPDVRALGVRRGLALGTAHRLAPEATFLDPEPDTDRRAVEAALECLATFSPGLAGATDPTDPTFGRLELQVDGLERLWGADPELIARITQALAPILPGPPRAGIAGTRFAATVAAGHAQPGAPVVVAIRGEAAFLAPLESGLLTPDLDVRGRLVRLGLRQVGQVAEIARSALVARFGSEGERMWARSRGEETDPFRPRRAPERLVLGLPIEPPVEALESLRFVLHRIAATLADQVIARGAAADRAQLRLTLDTAFASPGTPNTLTFGQRFPEPTAEAEAIERLFLARLERTPPPAPVERLELELAGVSPFSGQQLPLLVPQAARDSRLGWQLARLALAFGEDRICRLEVADPEALLPETRMRWIPVRSGASIEGQA